MTLESAFFLKNRLSFDERRGHLQELCNAWSASEKKVPMIAHDLHEYIFEILKRITQLSDDTDFLMNEERLMAATMTARGVIEAAGILIEFIRKFRSAIQRKDSDGALSVLQNFMFASMEFGDDHSVSTPHVMNGVRGLDKIVKGTASTYDVLCETVHPNWAGRVGFSSSPDDRDQANVERIYVSIFFLSDIIGCCIDQLRSFKVLLDVERDKISNLLVSAVRARSKTD